MKYSKLFLLALLITIIDFTIEEKCSGCSETETSRSRVKRTFGFPYGPYFYPGYPYGGFGGFFPPPIRFPPRFTNPFGQFGANLNLSPFGPFGPFGFDLFGPFRPGVGGNRGNRFGPPNPGFGLGIFGSGPGGSGGFDIFFNRG